MTLVAAAGHPRFRAVIFDWGDVISRCLVEQVMAEVLERYGVTREDLIRAYIAAAEPYERGAVSREWFVATFLAGLGPALRGAPDAAEVMEFPVRAWSVPDPRMVDLVAVLRGAFKTALLSNNIPEVVEAVERKMRLADLFDVVVLSYEEGVRKPDGEIYRRCLARLALEAPQAVFIDNNAEMCRGAEAVGIHAVRFRNYEQCVEELAALGIVRSAT